MLTLSLSTIICTYTYMLYVHQWWESRTRLILMLVLCVFRSEIDFFIMHKHTQIQTTNQDVIGLLSSCDFDFRHILNEFGFVEVAKICPECLGGLSVPIKLMKVLLLSELSHLTSDTFAHATVCTKNSIATTIAAATFIWRKWCNSFSQSKFNYCEWCTWAEQ